MAHGGLKRQVFGSLELTLLGLGFAPALLYLKTCSDAIKLVLAYMFVLSIVYIFSIVTELAVTVPVSVKFSISESQLPPDNE